MLTRHAAGRVYNFGYCIGRAGPGGKALSNPMDFALGSGGSLYITVRSHEHPPCSQGITKYTLDHQFLWEDRGPGFAKGQGVWPFSVAVDSDEIIYFSDDYTCEIFMYDKDGELLGKWGKKGSLEGELNGPCGLAFDKEDNLYVVDTLNHRIQKFTKDGKFLLTWGAYGSAEGELNMPWGITVDSRGDVFVADWRNDRVQKFSPEGEYLATFGSSGTGDGELNRPTDVAVDGEGDVYVTDWANDRLNIYTQDGVFITAFLGDAEVLSTWAQEVLDASPDFTKARRRADPSFEWTFVRPVAVNVVDEGRIMVLDQKRARLQIYIKERNYVPAAFNL